MRIAINTCYGGFHLPEEVEVKLGWKYDNIDVAYTPPLRADTEVVNAIDDWLHDHPDGKSSSGSELRIVEIPDEATDWMIDEYDGAEGVIYVLDGKLHTVY